MRNKHTTNIDLLQQLYSEENESAYIKMFLNTRCTKQIERQKRLFMECQRLIDLFLEKKINQKYKVQFLELKIIFTSIREHDFCHTVNVKKICILVTLTNNIIF